MPAQTGLTRKNHFLPKCYQEGFTDSSGRVWVKFANCENAKHLNPRSVGWERNLYVRYKGGIEDDKFDKFFAEYVEDSFALFCLRLMKTPAAGHPLPRGADP